MERKDTQIIRKGVKYVKFLLSGMELGVLVAGYMLRTHPRNNKSRKKSDSFKNRHEM